MKFVLFDDVKTHNELLQSMLEKLFTEHNLSARIALTTCDEADICNYAQNDDGDTIYFLDIEVDSVPVGIELCKKVKAMQPKSYIVYVSAFPMYALDCMHSHAFDFLEKPYTGALLWDCVSAILDDMREQRSGRRYIVKFGSRDINLNIDDVIYIDTQGNALQAHMTDGKVITWRGGLNELANDLKRYGFELVSRGQLVNIYHINSIDWGNGELSMDDGMVIFIARRRKNQLRAQIEKAAPEMARDGFTKEQSDDGKGGLSE